MSYARSMGGHSSAIMRATAIASTRMVLQSRIMGAQVGPNLIGRDRRAQISFSLCTPKSRRPYANIRAKTTNVAPVKRIVIATLTIVHEGAGRIALGNSIHVRNVN